MSLIIKDSCSDLIDSQNSMDNNFCNSGKLFEVKASWIGNKGGMGCFRDNSL